MVRLTSSRLPAKQLRPVGGRSILGWIMDQLAAATELDRVVIATVDESDNRPLRDLAARHEWELFWYRGGVDDVVGRLRHAAEHYDADICLLISGDCPLVHGPSIDALVRRLRTSPEADGLVLRPDPQGNACLLEGVQVARRRAWQHADAISDRPELREHQFPVIARNPDLFHRADAWLDAWAYGPRHRLSVDTWADLEFMQTLYLDLAADGLPFCLPEAVQLLARRPALRQINGHVHQRRLVEAVHCVLMVVDAGGTYGYGHFMRCRELAGQLVERLGWPVGFLLDDETAARMAEDRGFRVAWGALGRPARAGRAEVEPSAAARKYGLVLVDVSAARDPGRGWRAALTSDVPVVVMDREDIMAGEADLVIYPGVSGRARGDSGALPPVVRGLDLVILRREVRHHQGLSSAKDIDLLVYLHDAAQRQALRALAEARGWRAVLPEAFSDDFPGLLARSRLFLSGYGHSFYEALALGTRPVAWPLSPAHRADARAFYAAVGLTETLVEDVDAAGTCVAGLLSDPSPQLPPLEDGTPAIVVRLADLRRAWD